METVSEGQSQLGIACEEEKIISRCQDRSFLERKPERGRQQLLALGVRSELQRELSKLFQSPRDKSEMEDILAAALIALQKRIESFS
jgi:hypothetical protein